MTRDSGGRRFRLRGWPAGDADAPPSEVFSDDRAALKAVAIDLVADGGYARLDLAVWNDELNDWVRLERFEPG